MAKVNDLTVIYLTASELRPHFAEYARGILKKAIGDRPLISVSRKPIDFGTNMLDNGPRGVSNIYRQMLRACHIAKTEFVATAEDDCLYHKEHFDRYRPKPDEFMYDQNRFALFTWGEKFYSWRNRKSNCSLIAPRKLLIEALEERFARWPNGTPPEITGEVGRGMVERNMKITVRKSVEVFSKVSVIQVNHDASSEDRQRNQRKSYGPIRAYDLYYWRTPDEILKHYHHK